MTNLIIALVAAIILLSVGVILHNRIMAAINALHAAFVTDAEAVHSRFTAIEDAISSDVKKAEGAVAGELGLTGSVSAAATTQIKEA